MNGLPAQPHIDLLNQFRQYLLSQNVSAGSVANYLSDVKHFFNWLSLNSYPVQQVDPTHVDGYRSHLLEELEAPVATVNRRLTSLRRFGDWLVATRIWEANHAGKVANVALPKPVSQNQVSPVVPLPLMPVPQPAVSPIALAPVSPQVVTVSSTSGPRLSKVAVILAVLPLFLLLGALIGGFVLSRGSNQDLTFMAYTNQIFQNIFGSTGKVILDVNDLFGYTNDGKITPKLTLIITKPGSFETEDKGLVTNLNANFLQGKEASFFMAGDTDKWINDSGSETLAGNLTITDTTETLLTLDNKGATNNFLIAQSNGVQKLVIKSDGDLTTSGDLAATGSLTVSQGITTNNSSINAGSGSISAGSIAGATLTTTGNTSVGGNLTVSGSSTLQGLLTLNAGFTQTGSSSFSTGTGAVSLNGAVTAASTLGVTGLTTASGGLRTSTVDTSSGDLSLQPSTGIVRINTSSQTNTLRVYENAASPTNFLAVTYNTVTGGGTNADISINPNGTGRTSFGGQGIITGTATPGATVSGQIFYDTSDGKYKVNEGGTLKIICNTTDAGCGAGGGSVALSSILAATAGNTIASGDNAQVWQWSITTASKSAFTFGENVASTGSGAILLNIQTVSGSTALPLKVTAGGTANGVQVSTSGLLSAIGTGGIQATDVSCSNCVTLGGETTGTLGTGNGGTGLTSVGSANQVLGVVTGGGTLEYKTISGAANRITITPTAGDINITTPQDIATSSTPTFAAMTLSNTTNQLTLGAGAGTTGTFTWTVSGGNKTIIFPNTAGTVCLQGDSACGFQASGSYANTALSNLASVAINTALLPNANNTIDLGSTTLAFRSAYIGTSFVLKGATANTTLTFTNTGTVRSINIPDASGTFAVSGTSPVQVSAAGAISVDDATTTTKGIASFNSTNFSVAAGAVNTVQNINSTATPSFAALTLTNGTNQLTLGTGAGTTGTLSWAVSGGNKAIAFRNASGTVCLEGDTINCGFAPSTGGSYLAKNASDTSSASFLGNLYAFTNSNTGAAGVLALTNSGTNSTLFISQSANPTAGQALIFANNSNGTPSGNLIDLQAGTSKFSVSSAGNVTAAGTITAATSSTINSVSISSGAVSSVTTLGLSGAISGATATNTINNLIFNGTGGISGTLTSITPSGAFTVGATGQSLLLQGSTATITSTGAGNDIVLNSADTIEVQDRIAANANNTLDIGDSTNAFRTQYLGTSVVFKGASFNTTLAFTAPTANRAINLPNEDGTVCLQGASTCGFQASGSYANTALSNLASVAINTSLLPGSNNAIDLGSGAIQFRSAYVGTSIILGTNATNETTLTFTVPTGDRVINIPNASGTFAISGTAPVSVTAAGAIEVADATTAAKGIASFNSTNFSVTAGAVNTIQDIATTSTPSFAALTLSNASNQLVLGTGAGTTGTLTWTVSGGNKTITFPNNGGTVAVAGSSAIDLSSTGVVSLLLSGATADAATTSNSGLVVTSTGVSLLRGCGAGEILKWTSPSWSCAPDNSGGATSLQTAYETGNTINLTSAEGNLAVTLTSADVAFTTADGSSNFTTFSRANGAGVVDPAQLLLLDNLDLDRAVPIGLKIQSSAGLITTAIDLTDTEIGTGIALGANDITGTTAVINFTNFDVDGTGNLVVAGTYNTNTFTGSALTFGTAGAATIQSAASQPLTVQGNTTLALTSAAGALTLTSTGAGNDIVLNSADIIEAQDNLTLSGASPTISTTNASTFTLSSAASQAISFQPGSGIVNINTASQNNALRVFENAASPTNFIALSYNTLTGGGTNANIAINPNGTGITTFGGQGILTTTTTPASTSAGQLFYNSSLGKYQINEGGTVKTLCNTTDAACGAGSGSALSAISAATAGNSINNGDNAQIWNWSITTASKTGFAFSENTASSGSGATILSASTLSGSTATPLAVSAAGVTTSGISAQTIGVTGALTATGSFNGLTVTPTLGGTAAANTYTANAFNVANVAGTCPVGATCVNNALNIGTGYTNLINSANYVVTSAGAVTQGGNISLTGASPNIAATTAATNLTVNAGTTGTITLASTSTGDVQFFSSSNKITSAGALTIASGLTAGGNISLTGSNPTISVSTAANNLSLDAGTTGTVNIAGTSSGDILLGGGSASTGCTVTNSSGAFACTAGLTSTTGTFTATSNQLTLGTGAGTTGILNWSSVSGGDKTINFPNENGTVCLQGATSCNFAPSTGGNYLAKNAQDTSSASTTGYLYAFTNTNTGAAGVLQLTNSGTNSTLDINHAPVSSNSELPIFSSNGFTQTITGPVTNDRFNQFLAPTITAGTSQNVTNAATLYIDRPPVAAGSATITNSSSLLFGNAADQTVNVLKSADDVAGRGLLFTSGSAGTATILNSSYGGGAIYLTAGNASATGSGAAGGGNIILTPGVGAGGGAGGQVLIGNSALVNSGDFISATIDTTSTGNFLRFVNEAAEQFRVEVDGDVVADGDLSLTKTNATISNSSGTLTITPAGTLTLGATTQSFTLRGTSAATITGTSGANTTTVGFTTPTGARAINFPDEGGILCIQSSSACGFQAAGSYANTALSNLASVAINTSLLPGTDNSIDLGDGTHQFRSAYVGTSIILGTSGANETTINFTAPTASNIITVPNESGTFCTTGSVCTGYAPATGGNYLAKNLNDTSSFSFLGNLYSFTNTNTGAAGVLTLTNSGTNAAFSISQSGNTSSTSGLISVNNTNGTPSGNLLHLESAGGTNVFNVNASNALLDTTGNIQLNNSNPSIASTANANFTLAATGTNSGLVGQTTVTTGTGLAVTTGNLTTGIGQSITSTVTSGASQSATGLLLALTDSTGGATTGGFSALKITDSAGTGTGTGAKRLLDLQVGSTASTFAAAGDLIFGSVNRAASVGGYNLLRLQGGSTLENVLQVNGFGDFIASNATDDYSALDGTTTTNGTGSSSTSLVLTSAANFDVGNYVQVNSNNCGGTGINPCYAKITNKVTNTLTITPALTWANGATVNEVHIPEIGNTNVSGVLENRYGRGYFIGGTVAGNASTFYEDAEIHTESAVFNLITGATNNPNLTDINIAHANVNVNVLGNLAVTGTLSGAGPATGTSGYWSRSGTTLNTATAGDAVSITGAISTTNNISTTGSGTITSAGAFSGPIATNTINNLVIDGTGGISGTLTSITPSAGFTVGATTQTLTLQGSDTVLTETSGANTSTLSFTAPTAVRNTVIPDEGGTICIRTSANCGFAVTSPSGSYVQLAPASAQADATTNNSVYINKTGVASLLNLTQASASLGVDYTTTDISINRNITSATANIDSAGTILSLANASNMSGAGAVNNPTIIGVSNATPTGAAIFTGNYVDFSRADTAGGAQVSKFSISALGNVTAAGTYNTNTFTGSALTFGTAGAATIQSAASQPLTVQGNTTLNLTAAAGAVTLTSTGAGNDVIVNGADIFDVQDATVFSSSATFNTFAMIGNNSGNDYLGFDDEAGNPTCAAGEYKIWANSTDLKLKKCQNGTITDLDTTGAGGAVWSSLTDPTTNLTLAHAANTTTMGWTTTGALTAWTMNLVNNATTPTLQGLVGLRQDVSTGTESTDALLTIDNADTTASGSTVVDNAILVLASGDISNAITDAIDVSDADISNALNVGDNTITGGAYTITGTGAVTLTSAGAATWSTSAGNLTVQGAAALNLTAANGAVTITSTGAGNDIILASADIVEVQGNLTLSEVSPIISSTNASTLTISSAAGLTLTPAGAFTLGATTQQFTLQGTSASTITGTSGANTTTVGFTTPTGARAINFPDEGGTICLQTLASCGFAVTSPSGSYVQLAPSSAQADATTNNSIFINKTGVGSILNLTQSSTVTSTYSATDIDITRNVTSTTASTNNSGTLLHISNPSSFTGGSNQNIPNLIVLDNPTPTGAPVFGGNPFIYRRADTAGGAQVDKFVIQSSGRIVSKGEFWLSDTGTSHTLDLFVANVGGLGSTNAFLRYSISSVDRFAVEWNGNVLITPGNTSSNSELTNLKSSAFTQTITAPVTNARFNQFLAPTISAATSQNVTNAATLYVSGAPVAAGAGPATITHNYALWVAGGTVGLGTLGSANGSLSFNSSNVANVASNFTASASQTLAINYILPATIGSSGQVLQTSVSGTTATLSWETPSGGSCATCIWQVPGTTAQNTIAPTAASVVALTVKGTTGTSARVLEIYDSTATPTLQAYFDAAGALTLNQSLTLTGASPTISSTNASTFTINSAAAQALTLDSGTTGTVNLGTGNNAKTVNIGTGTAGNTINVGTNNTTADAINIGSALDTIVASSTNINVASSGNTSLGGASYANVRLGLRGTVTSANSAFGVYMGDLTLTPTTANNAYFQYVGGGTVDTGASNTVNNAYGLFAEAITKSGTGTIGNTYGIWVNPSTSGTNNYAGYFGGNVGIRNTTPGSTLTVADNTFVSSGDLIAATVDTTSTGNFLRFVNEATEKFRVDVAGALVAASSITSGVQGSANGSLILNSSNAANVASAFTASSSQALAINYILPATIGSSGQVLQTSVSGTTATLSWETPSGGSCSTCLLRIPAADADNTVVPTADVSSLILRQTSFGTPTKDIFKITDSADTGNFAQLTKDGAWTLNSAASQAFALKQGGNAFLDINASGAVTLQSRGTNQPLSVTSTGSGSLTLDSGGTGAVLIGTGGTGKDVQIGNGGQVTRTTISSGATTGNLLTLEASIAGGLTTGTGFQETAVFAGGAGQIGSGFQQTLTDSTSSTGGFSAIKVTDSAGTGTGTGAKRLLDLQVGSTASTFGSAGDVIFASINRAAGSTNLLRFQSGSSLANVFKINDSGYTTISPANISSDNEQISFKSSNFIQTISSGVSLARFNWFAASRIDASTAQNVTTAANLYVDQPIVTSGSATITNSYALLIGSSQLGGTSITNSVDLGIVPTIISSNSNAAIPISVAITDSTTSTGGFSGIQVTDSVGTGTGTGAKKLLDLQVGSTASTFGAAGDVIFASINRAAGSTNLIRLQSGSSLGDVFKVTDSGALTLGLLGTGGTGSLTINSSNAANVASKFNASSSQTLAIDYILPATIGSTNDVLTTSVSGTTATLSWTAPAGGSCATCIWQVPGTTAQNTIAPTAASVVALTVKGTTGTSARVLEIYDSTATPTLQAYFDAAGALTLNKNLTLTGSLPTISATNASAFTINGPASQNFNLEQGGTNFFRLLSTGGVTLKAVGTNQSITLDTQGTAGIIGTTGVTTGTGLALTTGSLTTGTGYKLTSTIGGGAVEIANGVLLTLTDSTTSTGGFSAIKVTDSAGIGTGTGAKRLLDLQVGSTASTFSSVNNSLIFGSVNRAVGLYNLIKLQTGSALADVFTVGSRGDLTISRPNESSNGFTPTFNSLGYTQTFSTDQSGTSATFNKLVLSNLDAAGSNITVGSAATLYVSGATTTTDSNSDTFTASITNNYALWVAGGTVGLGTLGSANGSLSFNSSNAANVASNFTASASQTLAINYILPATIGSTGDVLTTSVSGTTATLSWSAPAGGSCSTCLLRVPAADADNTVVPTADVSSLILRQTSNGTPTRDIFKITNSADTFNFAQLTSAGAWTLASSTNQNISLNPGGTGIVSLSSDIRFTNAANRAIFIADTASGGRNLTILAGASGAGTDGNGGVLNLTGGAASSIGGAAGGGGIVLTPGSGAGGGPSGTITMGSSSFVATNGLLNGTVDTTSTGNFLRFINEATEKYKIDVNGAVTQAGDLTFTQNATAVISSNNANNSIQLQASGTGNVILGTATNTQVTVMPSTLSGNAALTVQSSGANTLTLTAGSNTLTIGGTNPTLVTSGSNNLIINSGGSLTIGGGSDTGTVVFASGTNKISFTGDARQTKRIVLTPEYAGATLTGDGTSNSGTMTSDNQAASPYRNFYNWTSTGTADDYDIWVKVPIPSDFSEFTSSDALTIEGFSSTLADTTLEIIQVFDNSGTGRCTAAVNFEPGTVSTWADKTTDQTCTDTGVAAANDIWTVQIRLSSANAANARVGRFYIQYLSAF